MRAATIAAFLFASASAVLAVACVDEYTFGDGDAGRPDATTDAGLPDVGDERSLVDGADGGAGGDTDGATDGGFDANADGPELFPLDAGGCTTSTTSPTHLGNAHVDAGTVVAYSSEPASSGPHYEDWTAYKEFTSPVPPGNYVHSLEHGAIVLAYNCPRNAPCDAVKQHLRDVVAQIPNDPSCNVDAGHPRVKWLLFPNPKQGVPIAAATWGKLYEATCIDPAALRAFALANYGKGGETRCDEGAYR